MSHCAVVTSMTRRISAYLERDEGVCCGLLSPDNVDALVPRDPCTPAVVSRLLLDPCCLLKLPFALPLEGPGVPFKLLLVGIVLPFGVLLKG